MKLGITYTSEFAYLADGKNGLRVVQLTSPETPGNDGFSPRPTPTLIATCRLPKGGEALAISKGLDRDRAVDESGNQIAVFGRVGARPMNLQEQQRSISTMGASGRRATIRLMKKLTVGICRPMQGRRWFRRVRHSRCYPPR